MSNTTVIILPKNHIRERLVGASFCPRVIGLRTSSLNSIISYEQFFANFQPKIQKQTVGTSILLAHKMIMKLTPSVSGQISMGRSSTHFFTGSHLPMSIQFVPPDTVDVNFLIFDQLFGYINLSSSLCNISFWSP